MPASAVWARKLTNDRLRPERLSREREVGAVHGSVDQLECELAARALPFLQRLPAKGISAARSGGSRNTPYIGALESPIGGERVAVNAPHTGLCKDHGSGSAIDRETDRDHAPRIDPIHRRRIRDRREEPGEVQEHPESLLHVGRRLVM